MRDQMHSILEIRNLEKQPSSLLLGCNDVIILSEKERHLLAVAWAVAHGALVKDGASLPRRPCAKRATDKKFNWDMELGVLNWANPSSAQPEAVYEVARWENWLNGEKNITNLRRDGCSGIVAKCMASEFMIDKTVLKNSTTKCPKERDFPHWAVFKFFFVGCWNYAFFKKKFF